MILKFLDICPTIFSVGSDPYSQVSLLQSAHGSIHPFDGRVIFLPTWDATPTHNKILMISITVSTLYMEFSTSVENTLGHAITVYNPVFPKGSINNSPAR